MKPALRRRLAVPLLFAVIATGFWVHRIYVEQPRRETLQNSDLYRYFHPNAVFVHDALRAGHIPRWNPYQLAGVPYLALHLPGLLYPPNLLLFASLDPTRALEVQALLHLALSGFLTWLFAARLGLGLLPRAVAAIGFMLSGPMLLGIYYPPYSSTLAWLPGMLWALHGLATEARPRWALALAGCLALAFLGGHAQGFLYEVQFAAAYGLFGLVVLTPRGRRVRVALLALLAGVIALGLVAPQLLPTLELTRNSVRGFEGTDLEQAGHPLLAPRGLWRWLLGHPGGGPGRQWFLLLPYLGLPLVGCGVLARRQRAHWVFLLLAALVVGALLLGRLTPVFGWYYALPLGDLFRLAPSRMAFLFAFLVALLTAFGLQGLQAGLARLRLPAVVVHGTRAALASAIAIGIHSGATVPFAHPALVRPTQGAPEELVRFLKQRPGHERLFVENAQRLYHPWLLYKLGSHHRVFALPDYEPSVPSAYQDFFDPVRVPPWHGKLYLAPPAEPRYEAYRVDPGLLDLMGVRFYATPLTTQKTLRDRLAALAGGRSERFGHVVVYERASALPRAYTVEQARFEPDDAAALSRLRRAGFDPWREAIVVDAARAGSEPPQAPAAPLVPATIVEYGTEEVVVEADCRRPCWLVLTDLHYPGWHATVDGTPAPILRANGIFRAVELGPGRQRVVQRYAPRSLQLGIVLLAVALLLALATAGAAWRASVRSGERDEGHGDGRR